MNDIDSRMLDALTLDAEDIADNQVDVPVSEQRRFLKTNINILDVEGRKSIGDIIVMNNLKSKLKYCSDGTIINLDTLPEHVIEQMYILLEYKISNC